MHNIHHATYPENVNKKSVQSEWDEYAAREDYQEGCSGLDKSIRWIDHICKNETDAHQYIEDNDKGWYDQLAVKFYDYPSFQFEPSKTLQTLDERTERLCERYVELKMNVHYKGVKSQFVGCKNCGSKLSTKYIKANSCPLCGQDLRPESTLQLISNAEKNYQKAKKEAEERRVLEQNKILSKIKSQAVVKWLVKIEYHT